MDRLRIVAKKRRFQTTEFSLFKRKNSESSDGIS